MSADIIPFPTPNPRYPNLDALKIRLAIANDEGMYIKTDALDFVEVFHTAFFEQLSVLGFNISDEAAMKDLALVIESMKSYILKYHNVYHPLQNASNALFEIHPSNRILLKTKLLTNLEEKNDNS